MVLPRVPVSSIIMLLLSACCLVREAQGFRVLLPSVGTAAHKHIQRFGLATRGRALHSGTGFGGGDDKKKAVPKQQGQQSSSSPPAQGTAEDKAKKKPAPPPRGNNLLVVGLGNPGNQYKMTRHNAGFLVVEALAKRLGADLKLRSAFQGEYGSATYKGKSVGLLRPITFMNNSGQSVRKVLDYFKLPYTALLIVVDETALDLGQLRMRKTGSPGGHNGLKSVEGHIKTKDYARLRVGVGAAAPGKMVDHVLGEFTRSERATLTEMIEESCYAIEDWIAEDDIDKVMNRINAPR